MTMCSISALFRPTPQLSQVCPGATQSACAHVAGPQAARAHATARGRRAGSRSAGAAAHARVRRLVGAGARKTHKRVRRPQTIDESAMHLHDAAPNPGHVFKYLVRQLGAEGFCGALPRHAGHAGKVAWWPSARPRPAESQELPSGPWFHAYTKSESVF